MNRNQQGQGSGQGHYGRDQQQRRGGTQQGQPSRQQSQQQGGGRQGGRQAMQQGGDTSQWGARPFESMAEVALRGTALLFDLQMETARNVFRTQARTAAMLGVPDCSDLFDIGDERARRLFSMGAEQVLNTARQARETVAEMQRQFGRIAEQQTIGMTEEVRDQIEQISRQTEQGLQEIREIAASEAEQAESASQPSFDDEGEAARCGPNGEHEERGGAPGQGQQAMRSGEWEPRFDEGAEAANAARENAEDAGDATEGNAAHEGRTARESRSRARR